MKKIFMFLTLTIAILILFSFSSCSSESPEKDNSRLNRVLDNFTDVLKCNDKIVMTFAGALNSTQSYLEKPDEENYNVTVDAINLAINIINEIKIPENSCADLSYEVFSEIGLDITDYEAMFSSTAQERLSDMESLENLKTSIELAQTGYDIDKTAFRSFEYMLDFQNTSMEILTQVTYSGVNYLLLDIDANLLSSYRTNTLEQLESYQLYKIPWETDRSVIENKATILLDQLQRETENYGKYLADLTNMPVN